jgi:organic radical activating enzyme
VDNNSKLSSYQGVQVCKLDEVKDVIQENKVVVATAQYAYDDIKKSLELLGEKEYQHFCRIEDFMLEWYWKNRAEICIPQLSSSIISSCTFNCRKCATLMPYFKEPYEYSPEDILNDLDLLFQRVDYVASYYLVGGEPFLNKQLAEIISIIMEKYKDKIGAMQIISNGTIVPDENTLSTLKQYSVQVRLSDYTDKINYAEKFKQVVDTLKAYDILYTIHNFEQWMDLGFPDGQVDLGTDKEYLNQHMRACSTGCHALNDGKIFYCGTLFYAEKSNLFQLVKDDYIDLVGNINSNEQLKLEKKKIKDYFMGETPAKFLTLCRFCRGFGTDNNCVCEAAEQMKR